MPNQRLFTGGDHRFLQALRREIGAAVEVRLAVAFVMKSGVELLAPALRAALLRPGQHVRILTTDYLGVTEPEALELLLALPALAGAQLELRAYEARGHSFHPKAYLFRHASGARRAFVGSSNLSATALQHGVEWNWASLEPADGELLDDAESQFDELFEGPGTKPVTPEWIAEYAARRPQIHRDKVIWEVGEPKPDRYLPPPPVPNAVQEPALQALTDLRDSGENRALVVAATGLGKTYLAAFDSRGYRRVLFIAHRQELLDQAAKTFERVRSRHPGQRVGRVQGEQVDLDAPIVVAMVQTLAQERVRTDARLAGFDYVVVDEFHHAAADSYQKVLAVLRPKFLLGLTATPFRGDSRDLFALVGGNVAYEVGLFQAVAYGWLAPFHYYGVADTVEYSPALLNARRTGFDEEKLTAAVNRENRVQLIIEQWHQYAPPQPKALGFCVSIEHARYMAEQFCARGIPSLAVHSGPDSVDRRDAIRSLHEGSVQCLFTVDLFNEGVDIPAVNLVLMLRPTESMTVFVQQLGRGLRRAEGKPHLVVLDFIGNYRNAHVKLAFLTGNRTDDKAGPELHRKAYAQLAEHGGLLELDGGIRIELEEKALATLREALRTGTGLAEALKADLEAVAATIDRRHHRRPLLDEVRLMGTYRVRAHLNYWKGWANVLEALGWATEVDCQLATECGEFLRELEKTQMTKSYKMVVLQAMLCAESGLRSVTLAELAAAFRSHFRQARYQADIRGTEIEDIEFIQEKKLQSYIHVNPVTAWVKGGWFAFIDEASTNAGAGSDAGTQLLRYIGPVPKHIRAFREAVAERVTWRLNQYMDRHANQLPTFKVMREGRSVCVMFGKECTNAPDVVPRRSGWQPVEIAGDTFYGKFVKVALNVLKARPVDDDTEPNVLTTQLARLFDVPVTELLSRPRKVALHRRDDGTFVLNRGGNA